MRRESVGKRIWRILCPLVVYFAATAVVTCVVMMLYFAKNLPEIMKQIDAVTTQEDMAVFFETFLQSFDEKLLNLMIKYDILISAIAAVGYVPILACMWRNDRKREEEAGIEQKKKASFVKYLYVFGIGIPIAIGINNLLILGGFSKGTQEFPFGIMVICSGVLIPIGMEFVFRGMVYGRLRRYISPRMAMIISSLGFAMLQEQTIQVICAALCGFLWAWLYEKYGSLWAPILAHVLMRLLPILLGELKILQWVFREPMRVGIITVVCAAVASTVYLFIREIDNLPSEES